MATPKFIQIDNSFHAELKKKINDYFELNKIDKTGNYKLYTKAIILTISFFTLYGLLVFGHFPAYLDIIFAILFAFTVSAIGFNIMHDGGHGSFSKNKTLNKIAAYSLDILGASSFMWNMKHNIIHHTYTNVEGFDDDINVEPYMRMAPSQKKLGIHKYQHRYFFFLYSILYLAWVFLLDYGKYFRNAIGDIQLKKMKPTDHILFWTFKAIYLITFIIFPIIMVGFTHWLVGFLIFGMGTGVIISTVFQLAHTVEDTAIVSAVGAPPKVEEEWAIHQFNTTANFATDNKIVNWFTGGLNFQIEHHLFPKISHVHYPTISKICKEVCAKYNVNYFESPKMFTAIKSHIKFLKMMGSAA